MIANEEANYSDERRATIKIPFTWNFKFRSKLIALFEWFREV